MRGHVRIAVPLVALAASVAGSTIGSTTGCTPEEVPYTQVTVNIRVNSGIIETADQMRIRVWRGRYQTIVRDCFVDPIDYLGRTDNGVIAVPVVPEDNVEPTDFTLVADIYRGNGMPVATQRAIVSYVADAVREVELSFGGACPTGCGDYETCGMAGCVSSCFLETIDRELVRGPCDLRGDPFEMCARTPATVTGSEFMSESACADDTCFCREPEGCLSRDAAACCARPLGCGTICLTRPVRSGGCPLELVMCADGVRCVVAGTEAVCCGGGISACFQT